MTATYILGQAGYNSQQPAWVMYVVLVGIVLLFLFFVTRELFLWYLKINDMVKNQEKQIKLSEEQTKLLRQLTGSPDIDN